MNRPSVFVCLLAFFCTIASPLLHAATFVGDSSMSSVDASGLSVYTSSMGGGNPYRAEHYQVKEIAYEGGGHYRVQLACAAPCAALSLPVAAPEATQLRIGDGIHSMPKTYGLAFDLDRTGTVVALLLKPAMAREVQPVRVL